MSIMKLRTKDGMVQISENKISITCQDSHKLLSLDDQYDLIRQLVDIGKGLHWSNKFSKPQRFLIQDYESNGKFYYNVIVYGEKFRLATLKPCILSKDFSLTISNEMFRYYEYLVKILPQS